MIRKLNGFKLGENKLVMEFAKVRCQGSTTHMGNNTNSELLTKISDQEAPSKPTSTFKESVKVASTSIPHSNLASKPPIVLRMNECFLEELNTCVILTTIRPESIESVSMIIEGRIGFRGCVHSRDFRE